MYYNVKNNENTNMLIKLPLSILASIICLKSFASYTVIYPVKFVNFKEVVKWEITDSLYSDWINTGAPINCKNQYPLENTVPVNQIYEKTISQCDMTQERTVTKQLIRNDTHEIKTDGSYIENRTINDYSYVVQSKGTLVSSECRYSLTGTKFYWYDAARQEGATDGTDTSLFWNGVEVYKINRFPGTEITVNNYKYKRSTYKEKTKKNDTMWHIFYQICRTPI